MIRFRSRNPTHPDQIRLISQTITAPLAIPRCSSTFASSCSWRHSNLDVHLQAASSTIKRATNSPWLSTPDPSSPMSAPDPRSNLDPDWHYACTRCLHRRYEWVPPCIVDGRPRTYYYVNRIDLCTRTPPWETKCDSCACRGLPDCAPNRDWRECSVLQ